MKTISTWIFIAILPTIIVTNLSCNRKDAMSEVSAVSIYYVDWSLTTFRPLTCDILRSNPSPIVVTEPTNVKRLVAAVLDVSGEKRTEMDELDVRVCCVFTDTVGTDVLEVSFSPTSLMQIDGEIYNTDDSLFELVISFLPDGYLST